MTLDLDKWTESLLGKYMDCQNLRKAINSYTEDKKWETVAFAKAASPYYAKTLGEFDVWEDIPLMDQEDLREHGNDILCVSPSEISRIVTMQTSGTTGGPKRIHFTRDDQQLTIDYFNHGMRLIVDSTDTVLILMPARSAGSIGLLLGQGLRDAGVRAIEYGLPFSDQTITPEEEARQLIELIKSQGVTSIVAVPAHMDLLAREGRGKGIALRSVLLSADFVPDETVKLAAETFGCQVFEHYGMTEMGLGCAVSCGFGEGYHIREADLLIELIDPETLSVIDEKENPETPGYSAFGEVVFTTLTRRGMPFVRYRTGDISRWILTDCPCGSVLKRLDKVVPGSKRIEARDKKQKEKL